MCGVSPEEKRKAMVGEKEGYILMLEWAGAVY